MKRDHIVQFSVPPISSDDDTAYELTAIYFGQSPEGWMPHPGWVAGIGGGPCFIRGKHRIVIEFDGMNVAHVYREYIE